MIIPILLVDDNDDDLLLLRLALSRIPGLRIAAEAHDGDAALAYLRRAVSAGGSLRPAMVVMDLNMPGRDGFDTLEAMKQDPRLQAIPVVILTTSQQQEDVLRAYGLGAASYIRKPNDTGEFRDLLAHFGTYWTHVSSLPTDR